MPGYFAQVYSKGRWFSVGVSNVEAPEGGPPRRRTPRAHVRLSRTDLQRAVEHALDEFVDSMVSDPNYQNDYFEWEGRAVIAEWERTSALEQLRNQESASVFAKAKVSRYHSVEGKIITFGRQMLLSLEMRVADGRLCAEVPDFEAHRVRKFTSRLMHRWIERWETLHGKVAPGDFEP